MIREITPADDPALAALVRTCLKAAALAKPGTAYFDPELAHLSAYYAQSPRRDYFVYTDGKQVLGGVGFAEYDATHAEVQKLYLAPEARGQHLGALLLAHCEQAAKAAGWQGLYLETHTNLATAMHLYESRGYRRLDAPLHEGPHTVMNRFYVKTLQK